ncbi:MAG: dihydrolipoamide acetyltransferase family protein [Ilumatobacteraceae bacterium]
MATEFLMPKLGLTMEEGTILEWLVADGTTIEPGMPVLRIETDKVESDVEANVAGRLHLSAEVGETYACGAVIGYVLAEGEAAPTTTAARTAPNAATTPLPPSATSSTSANPSAAPVVAVASPAGRRFVSPNAYRVAATLGVDLSGVRGSGPGGRVVSEDVEEAAAHLASRPVVTARPTAVDDAVSATAAARQLADLLGVDLRTVPSGRARIERDDVALHVRQRLAGAVAKPASTGERVTAPVTKMSGMRSTIAKRMHTSLQEMAQLTLHMDADFDEVLEHRDDLKDREDLNARDAVPGITDYLVAAAGRAIARHRYVNSQIVDNGIAELPDVHVGLAVAVPGGLMVPVIRHADRRSLFEISVDSKRLAGAARAGRLQLEDLEGGTFSVTALGMYGVDGFTPVINPPNAAILGVGRLRNDVVVKKKGKINTVTRLTLSLTWDHRVFDGAPAAEFCRTIVEILRDPESLC